MKDALLKKKQILEDQLTRLQREIDSVKEQFTMTQGAYQYNQLLLSELEAAEAVTKAPEVKEEAKA